MDRVAVFVDAGYLFMAGAEAVFGEKRKRSEMTLDHDVVVGTLSDFATQLTGLPLLRIYWYDGTSGPMTSQQLELAKCHNVKVRLGYLNSSGQQKGVDSLIITDMITLARNGAIADAVLLSGDEDVRVGMQQAQEWGVRVHLLGIDTGRNNQSLSLRHEADTTATWTASDVRKFLKEVDSPTKAIGVPAVSETVPEDVLNTVIHQVISGLDKDKIKTYAAMPLGSSVPSDIDSTLLSMSSKALGRRLEKSEVRQMRRNFFKVCKEQADPLTPAE